MASEDVGVGSGKQRASVSGVCGAGLPGPLLGNTTRGYAPHTNGEGGFLGGFCKGLNHPPPEGEPNLCKQFQVSFPALTLAPSQAEIFNI